MNSDAILDISFKDTIKEISTHIVKWEIGPTIAVLVDKFLIEYEKYLSFDYNLKKRINERIHYWNLIDLGLLFETLAYNIYYQKIKSPTDFTPLIDELIILFLKEMNESNIDLNKRVILTFTFIKAYLYLGKTELIE
ncbi:MAG: hypothetical protein ACXAC7_22185, partial [Candidatus Hodarchaeales archaeon]